MMAAPWLPEDTVLWGSEQLRKHVQSNIKIFFLMSEKPTSI